jgi:hypothetical protein
MALQLFIIMPVAATQGCDKSKAIQVAHIDSSVVRIVQQLDDSIGSLSLINHMSSRLRQRLMH